MTKTAMLRNYIRQSEDKENMSSRSNNFRATSGNWETGRDYGAYTSNHDELNRVNPMFSRSRSIRVTPVSII